MDKILVTLAICGLVMIIFGRILIVRRAQHLGRGWTIAFCSLPLAELMFLTRYWEETKVGAFTSLCGLALIMPWSGQMLRDTQRPISSTQIGAGTGGRVPAASKKQIASEQEIIQTRIAVAKERIEAMNARLLGWYKEIQERRESVEQGQDKDAVVVFNMEAKAYHEFFAVVREESRVLEQLQEKLGIADTDGSPQS